MKLTGYGLREWLTITIVCIVAVAACASQGWWWGIAGVALAWLALVSFFRDPRRPVPEGLAEGDMLSPADGTVSAVTRVEAHEAVGDEPAVIVRIFLSIFNVHVNRAPCTGKVVGIAHRPGRYLDARRPESAEVNESNLVTLRFGSRDETLGVRQVSGAVARRIVCPLGIGDVLRRGERYGMIKFGSTTELILPRPDDVAVHVKVGDKVRGGLTKLATLAPPRRPGREPAARPSEARSRSSGAASV